MNYETLFPIYLYTNSNQPTAWVFEKSSQSHITETLVGWCSSLRKYEREECVNVVGKIAVHRSRKTGHESVKELERSEIELNREPSFV